MGLKIFAFRFVSLCRSISKQQIHSMRGGRVRGWSMLSGIFLHMYCYVLYVISGPHRRAPNGMSWMLNSHKLNCTLCLPNLATASALTLYHYPTVTEAFVVVKYAITETLVGLIQVVQRWLEGVMVIRMILFTTKEKKERSLLKFVQLVLKKCRCCVWQSFPSVKLLLTVRPFCSIPIICGFYLVKSGFCWEDITSFLWDELFGLWTLDQYRKLVMVG